MKILLIEPFFTGSHESWAKGYQQYSEHEIQILSLPGRFWKWRMYGGAVELAAQCNALKDFQPDLLLTTDMLDVTTFIALTNKAYNRLPVALYFHENQITYPWSSTDPDITLQRNNQYGFINYTSALAADQVFFNSTYHLHSFIDALPSFLKQFPDYKGIENIPLIKDKSQVLPLGIDLSRFNDYQQPSDNAIPILLWNHRWEYDKNPDLFFKTLMQLKAEGISFQLVVVGDSYQKIPAVFKEAKKQLQEEIIQYGKVSSFQEYAEWLWKADILPVTNQQDFFGQSVVEAMYCNCHPILPQRLAYPMHIPPTHHADYFYHTEEAFYQMLKNAISNFKTKRNPSVQSFVSHYDWRILATQYDAVLAELIK